MLIKLIFLLICSSFCFIHDINYPFYIINNNNFYPINIQINKNYSLSTDGLSYYGYLKNIYISSFSCCSINGSLIKQIQNQYYDSVVSSCGGFFSNSTNQCIDTLQCEKYNDFTTIKYILGMNENNFRCFFNYTVKKIDTKITITQTNYTFQIQELDNNEVNNLYIEGKPKFNYINYNSTVSCIPFDYSFYFFNYLDNTFNKMKDIIETQNTDCKTFNNLQYNTSYLDNGKYLNLEKTYIDLFEYKTSSFSLTYNGLVEIINNDNLVIKKLNKGCLITNIEVNNWMFYFDVNCFDDFFKYIKFSLNYNDKEYLYMYEVKGNNFAFKLFSFEYPLNIINYLDETPIILNYNFTQKNIEAYLTINGKTDKPIIDDLTISTLTRYIVVLLIIIILISLILLIIIKQPNKLNKIKDFLTTKLQIQIDSFKKIMREHLGEEENSQTVNKRDINKTKKTLFGEKNKSYIPTYDKEGNKIDEDVKLDENDEDEILIKEDDK